MRLAPYRQFCDLRPGESFIYEGRLYTVPTLPRQLIDRVQGVWPAAAILAFCHDRQEIVPLGPDRSERPRLVNVSVSFAEATPNG
jgi:hypothetical protein